MSGRFRVACVQNCAGTETAANLEDCAELVRGAAAEGARLICLPEYFTGLDLKGALLLPEAELSPFRMMRRVRVEPFPRETLKPFESELGLDADELQRLRDAGAIR